MFLARFLLCFMILKNEAQSFLTHVKSRIVGGKEVDIVTVPYIVAIRKDSYRHCGGALVAQDKILTAAQCVDQVDSLESLEVLAGIEQWSSGLAKPYNVTMAQCHPNYLRGEADYDIAMLHFEPPTEYHETTIPIKVSKTEPLPDEEVYVSGFGTDGTNATSGPGLKSAKAPVIHRSVGANYYNDHNIRKTLLFIGSKGYGICSGDIGGPVVKGKELVGIIAFIGQCSQTDAPAAAINLADKRIATWIQNTL